MSKKLFSVALLLILGGVALYLISPLDYVFPERKEARLIDQLVERNLDARGGASAWEAVSTLQLSGRIDVGQGVNLPYVLEQQRPGKMRLEFVFDGETAVQAFDGKVGWKLLPYLGRKFPEPMSETEVRAAEGTSDIYGLLFDYEARGHKLELLGQESVAGRDAYKLKVTLPGGSVRWVYLDAETALEIKVEAERTIAGRAHLVETFYQDWQETDGLLIARRQETQTEGDKESHFFTVERVKVNPAIADDRFTMPATVAGAQQVSL
jgi:hypothetical protein